MLNPTEILMSKEAAFLHPIDKACFELFEGLVLSLSVLANIDIGIPIFSAYPEGPHVGKFLVCIILTLVSINGNFYNYGHVKHPSLLILIS